MADQSGLGFTITPAKRWRFHLLRGARALEAGDFSGARRHFAAAYQEAPEEPLACLAWGRELLRSGETVRSEALLRRAWDRDPDLLSAGLQLARVIGVHGGRAEDALRLLDEVDHRKGARSASYLLRAEILRTAGDYGRAREACEKAYRVGADAELVRAGLARIHNAEGVSLAEQGAYHQALFALKRASDLDPDWSGPLVNSGAIFERLGQHLRAREQYQSALGLDPVNPVALFNLAELMQREGAHAEALRHYRRLLAIHPGYPGAQRGIRRLIEPTPRRPMGQPPHTPSPDHGKERRP